MTEDKPDRGKESKVESKAATKEKKPSRKPSPKTTKEPNVVYIGTKPPMDYVMAVITAFNMTDGAQITLKARGRAISTAVDVAEITRNRFLQDIKLHDISIGTEEIVPKEGGNPRNVSTMEIGLKQ
jgi:DNA-binding protein